MTRLGYGEEIRRWRVEKYNEHDRHFNSQQSDITYITAGSKGEGLTCLFESDEDILLVVNGVLCVEAGITIPDDINRFRFRMDTRVYPGHCILLQERKGHNMFDVINNALCDNGYGDIILSSCLLVDEFSACVTHSSGRVRHERAGPSIPATYNGILHTDHVVGLRCHCPNMLQRWATRPRHWPPPLIVNKVVSLGAYVTPVGVKGSEYNHMEWRICFNTGEAELVNSLTDTQAKVYVMLKMILKEILKPNNKEITSYVLKNIIFWQAENTPHTTFNAHSLLHWLIDGLRELRTAIESKKLSYYMIPERNLLASCGLTVAQQRKWVADITKMVEEGPMVVLRLEKIRKAIVASPEPMLWFSQKRMEMEMLHLEWVNRWLQCRTQNRVSHSDFVLTEINRRIDEIFREVELRMLQDGSSSIKDLLVGMMT